MPLFDPNGVEMGEFVERLCLVLDGAEGVAALYLAMFMGTPKHHHINEDRGKTKVIFELKPGEEGPEGLQPAHYTMVGGKKY